MDRIVEQRLNVLVVHPDVPPPDRDAASIRLFGVIELLTAGGHRITYLAREGVSQEHNTALLLRRGVEAVYPVDPERVVGVVLDLHGTRWGPPKLDLERILIAERFDVAWLSCIDLAEQYVPLIRRCSPATRIVTEVAAEADQITQMLRAVAPPRWQARADAPWIGRLLSAYASEFSADDAATLVLNIPKHDSDAPRAAQARVLRLIAEEGLELDAMADVEITDECVQPSRTVVFDAPPAAVAAPTPARSRRSTPQVAVAMQASPDTTTLQAQLDALAEALPRDGVEVVIVAGGLDAATSAVLERANGAKLVRCDRVPGRAQAQTLAAEATNAPILITLGPLALPQAGFVDPLAAAVRSGASFAGPAIDGVHGLRVAPDGSLWPRASERDGTVQALAFDCLAAARETWTQAPKTFAMLEGHPERQLAEWAVAHGKLASVSAARVRRVDSGPVSVVICTRNRAVELPDGVALLVASGATRGGNEVVILDNASTDDTAEVAAELARTHPGVRFAREERPGVSLARNAGAAAAGNPLICYIDDDARPGPGWREGLTWALTRPGVIAAAGPICALWPGARREPGWPPRGLDCHLSVLDSGDAVCMLVPPDSPYCANLGFRLDALWAVGGFDPHIGYAPDRRWAAEELAVAWKLHLKGLGGTLYVPEAAVGHRISDHRLTDTFLVERSLLAGIEHVHLRAERSGKASERIVADAADLARQLFGILPLSGALTLEEALDQVQTADAPLRQRAAAAEALGGLAGSVLMLGEHTVMVGGLRLALRDEHLRGLLLDAGARSGVATMATR